MKVNLLCPNKIKTLTIPINLKNLFEKEKRIAFDSSIWYLFLLLIFSAWSQSNFSTSKTLNYTKLFLNECGASV